MQQLPLSDGSTLEFLLQLPDDHDPLQAAPLLLALPPGDQSRDMVDAGMGLYWSDKGRELGWIVASPVAPAGSSFFTGSEFALVELLDHLEATHLVLGNRAHVAGPSNGGRSGFRLALQHPDRVASLLVVPGFPPTPADEALLHQLLDISVAMFVGGDDGAWVTSAQDTLATLQELGHTDVSLTVFPDEGHTPPSATPELLFSYLERFRAEQLADLAAQAAVAAVLDDFHAAASAADGPRYFGHFTPNAVFLGTDPQERWTIRQFRAYAEPYFEAGTGWTYRALERSVRIGSDGATAWFDERLDNDSYGQTRGTGVLVRRGAAWRIAQYSLSLPVPNDLAKDLVERIRGE